MKDIISTAQLIFSAIGGALGFFLGGWDGFLYALVIFVSADFLTGLMASAVEKKISSEVGYIGIIKKVFIFILVGIGSVIDKYIIGNGSILRNIIIFFYISEEGISIIENAGRAGLKIPQKLKDVLEQLKSKGGDT